MKMLVLLLLCLTLCSCNSKGNAFQNLEEASTDTTPAIGEVKIQSFIPLANPVIFTATSVVTFAVSVYDGAGTVNYKFTIDDSTVLQNSSSPFLEIDGSVLGAGPHELKVTASNSTSSDSHSFTLRKNNPASVISSSPSFTSSLLNCAQDTLTMSAVTTDADGDTYTQKWYIDNIEVISSTPFTAVTNTSSSSQLAYTPDCSVAGYRQISLKLDDGHEVSTYTWSVSVINPAVETIISYFPTSNNVTALSYENSKTFNASGSGVGSLTFVWKLDGTTVKTDTGVVSSNYNLDTTSGTLSTGNHTLEVVLTDSTVANDPPSPVKRSWLIYKNQKPTILSASPNDAKLINLNTQLGITANIQDALDTVTTRITKGALNCASSACGLSSIVLPTASGTFSAIFTPGLTYLGSNSFTLRVTDTYGEFETYDYNISANYFSDACNNLTAGKICTLAGLPGLGSGLNLATESNKVRVSPSWMTEDDQGNWFFSDYLTNTVWYYNSKNTDVTLWGNSSPSATIVPANSIYVVAGTGVVGVGGVGQLAKKIPLNFGGWGGGLAWDTSRRELYIADYGNGRVIRIGQNGIGNLLCGASNLNTQNSVAVNNDCTNAMDVEFDNTNRRVYVSLYGRHTIKYFDVSDASSANWKGFSLAGTTSTGANTDGSANLSGYNTTITGTARLNGPWGMKLDTTDNILYVGEYGSCRLRAIGLPGANTQNVFGKSITAGNVVTLAGNGCTSATINTDTLFSANLFNRPMEIEVLKDTGAVKGIFVSDFYGHRVNFLNNTNGSISLGGQIIGSQKMANILGTGNTVPANPPSGITTTAVNPMGLFIANNKLFVGSRGDSLIRSLDLSAGNGAVGNVLGGTARAGYSGNSPLDSRLVTFSSPLSLLHQPNGNLLYVSDVSNAMLRSINLTTGKVEDFIGVGSSQNENLLNTVTTATRVRSPRAMTIYNDFFLYADGGSNNCFIRAFNPLATDQLIFNTQVNQNRTNTIAGFYGWCSDFVGTTALGTTDIGAQIKNPYGLGVDTGTDTMYITSNSSHCVLSVNAAGMMVPVIGTCGTSTASPVYGGSYPDSGLLLNAPAELIMDPLYPGNFFFIDFSNSNNAHVKYVNTSTPSGVSFFGGAEYVAHQSVGTVLAATNSPGYLRGLAAFEEWICFTSGASGSTQGNNTVVCRNRDTGEQQVLGLAGAGGIQSEQDQEGASVVSGGSTVTFAVPTGIAFDSDGNLFVSEYGSHVIRKIKRWW